jgi:sodium/proline symporter
MASKPIIESRWIESHAASAALVFRCFPPTSLPIPVIRQQHVLMGNWSVDFSVAVFGLALLATFVVAILGRRDSKRVHSAALAEHRLNRWLVGLSAGATANSGFVVTGAVGLGYMYGMQWLLLPLSWLLGDVLFWLVFPNRINETGRAIKATTMTDVIVDGMKPSHQIGLKRAVAIVILVCLGGYVSAQWLAGQKFLQGAFGFGNLTSLLVFAALIVVYTAIGGFRGSVYADTMQAIVRLIGTAIAMTVVVVVASRNSGVFWRNIGAAGPHFLAIFPKNSLIAALPVILGFAAASLGFGLGQPQMITRYLAGASPHETQAAWGIYNTFVQSTWIAMTLFGVALRGVMPGIADPEMGLSLFHRSNTGPLITGIISADIFATIAATSNSLLVAMAQTVSRDLFSRVHAKRQDTQEPWPLIAVLGAATMVVSLDLHSTVVDLALSSVSLMGAGLAPAMLIRVLNWRRTDQSLIVAVIVGTCTAILWHSSGLGGFMNEAAPGIILALAANFVVARFSRKTRPALSVCQ